MNISVWIMKMTLLSSNIYLSVSLRKPTFMVCSSIYYKITSTKGASILPGTRFRELPCFYITPPLPVVQEKLKIIPLLVVQEKLKTFNVGQAFETQLELHKFFNDSHFHLDKLLDTLKVNTLS